MYRGQVSLGEVKFRKGYAPTLEQHKKMQKLLNAHFIDQEENDTAEVRRTLAEIDALKEAAQGDLPYYDGGSYQSKPGESQEKARKNMIRQSNEAGHQLYVEYGLEHISPHLAGTYSHYQAGTFEWSAIGETIAQRAYDWKISTEETTKTKTKGAEIGVGASVGVGVSKSTGKTQGVDWDFGQSVSLNVDASPPRESPAKPVTGQWGVSKSFDLVKKCLACGIDVSDMIIRLQFIDLCLV